MSQGDELRNLMVNYLPSTLTPASFRSLFQPFGDIETCRLVMDHATGLGMGYGFVKYTSDEAASAAIAALNGAAIEDKVIKVSYARKNGGGSAPPIAAPVHNNSDANVYVAQLDRQITKHDLEQIFSPYGSLTDVKILTDPSGQSKGVGFVRFASRDQAQLAVNDLNGNIPPGSIAPIVVRFAEPDKKRKAIGGAGGGGGGGGKGLRYDPMAAAGRQRMAVPPPVPYPPAAVYPYAPAYQQPVVAPHQTYCLFVYNIPASADDSLLYRLFGPFGAISTVKINHDPTTGKSKGYGFVHFVKFEDAQQAVLSMNGAVLENKMLQVSFKSQKGQ